MTTPKHVSGTIKALEWTQAGSHLDSDYIDTFGLYQIAIDGGAILFVGHAETGVMFATLEAAQAAAQADFEARILAAIQPDHEPVVQCCMCGKKGLSTVEGDGGEECQLHDDRWTCSRACYDKATDPEPQPVAWPDWLWYCETVDGEPIISLGRWPKNGLQKRYKLAEIQPVEHDHPTTPSSAGTVSVEAAAKVLYDARNPDGMTVMPDYVREMLRALADGGEK